MYFVARNASRSAHLLASTRAGERRVERAGLERRQRRGLLHRARALGAVTGVRDHRGGTRGGRASRAASRRSPQVPATTAIDPLDRPPCSWTAADARVDDAEVGREAAGTGTSHGRLAGCRKRLQRRRRRPSPTRELGGRLGEHPQVAGD